MTSAAPEPSAQPAGAGEDRGGLRPIDPSDPDVQALAYIDLARLRGIPWSVIGQQFGLDRRGIKRHRALLDRRVKLKQAGIISRPPAAAGSSSAARPAPRGDRQT